MVHLHRPKDFESENKRAWGTILKSPRLRAADRHEMVISKKIAERLDHLSLQDEKECWELAFSRARQMLEDENIHSVGFFVNDGRDARQTAAHVHIHVLGFERESKDSLSKMFAGLRKKFGSAAGLIKRPESEKFVTVSLESIAEFRTARKLALAKRNVSSLSVFSENLLEDMSGEISFVIQGWSKNNPAPFSLTNMIRCWLGMRDTPNGMEPGSFRKFKPVKRK